MADKHVNRENINTSLDGLNPTAEQSERMWQRLAAAMEEKNPSDSNRAEQKAEEKIVRIDKAAGRKKRSEDRGEQSEDNMRYLLTSEQMKTCDRTEIEHYGVPSVVLMERAALAVRDVILNRYPRYPGQ